MFQSTERETNQESFADTRMRNVRVVRGPFASLGRLRIGLYSLQSTSEKQYSWDNESNTTLLLASSTFLNTTCNTMKGNNQSATKLLRHCTQ